VRPLEHVAANVSVCVAVARSRTVTMLLVTPTSSAQTQWSLGGSLPGRIRIEYLRQESRSWWEQALSVARRMGLGRDPAGTGISLLVLVLMLAVTSVVCELALRAPGSRTRATTRTPRARTRAAGTLRRFPRAGVACALVAFMNAAAWSLITPPFQAPDEPAHFAYVQLLAENHRLPASELDEGSPAEQAALNDLEFEAIRFDPVRRSLLFAAQQRKLEHDLALPLSQRGLGGAGTASLEPPLYYAIATIPYELGAGGSLLTRLELVRLLSALFAAITALFAYLFVREALPGSRSAWAVGGLAVALFPLLGFVSSGIDPDAMLFAICAALYYCLARGFRRGLTPRLALIIAALTATGFVTKLNFAGFAPGVIAGLVLLAVRTSRRRTPTTPAAYRTLAIALPIAVCPVLLYLSRNVLAGKPPLGVGGRTFGTIHSSLPRELSYIWQLYLPPLPWMHVYFPGVVTTTRELWFNGLVGMYGWADTMFPVWVYNLALILASIIAVLAARELIRVRHALRPRLAELATYGLTAVGVMTLVGTQSYLSDAVDGREPYWEPRYLLPMLGLWGLVTTVAARGAGRRWGMATGVLIVFLLLTHDLVSQLQVIARYYG